MTTAKSLGIWMDHASAHLMEYTRDPIETKTIETKFSHDLKQENLSKSESVIHNKEQHQEAAYYKQLGAIIKNYEDVVLFGPTDAKTELFNILRADHLFEHIRIDIVQTDKMTDPQQHAFVKAHFQ